MIRVSAVRFFLTVAGAPWWILAALAAATVTGVATLVQDAREVDSALALVLLLQMFAAASAFNATAARGYFDPILVSGRQRPSVAVANLFVATLPGIVAWVVLVIVAVATGGAHRALTPHRQVALLLVSSVAWAFGVALPRMAPGVLWCAALLAFALSRGALSDQLVLMQSVPGGLADVLAVSVACLVCPFLLLGDFAGPANLSVVVVLVTVAAIASLCGILIICRRDYVLMETV